MKLGQGPWALVLGCLPFPGLCQRPVGRSSWGGQSPPPVSQHADEATPGPHVFQDVTQGGGLLDPGSLGGHGWAGWGGGRLGATQAIWQVSPPRPGSVASWERAHAIPLLWNVPSPPPPQGPWSQGTWGSRGCNSSRTAQRGQLGSVHHPKGSKTARSGWGRGGRRAAPSPELGM